MMIMMMMRQFGLALRIVSAETFGPAVQSGPIQRQNCEKSSK